uniref:ATP synthase F0 subunit 8 n=1 Tax=Myomenippe fornasinii TaxID=1511596 RepID=A0A068WAS9_9EUCA|nr:ATP synthase F0 subunit 8 [Myomenippe fornasinii]CDR98398.1 ATP synthase F0 subunit 8 [Myomenippe fornasinii]
MPQMAPLMWLILYFFFLLNLMFFIILNFYIKPFNTTSFDKPQILSSQKLWKL